jgi:hypothetical protein
MRRALIVSITTFLVCGFLAQPSVAAVKAGAACKKAGQTGSAGGAKYICSKSGKKLVWKQVAAPKPTPSKTSESINPTETTLVVTPTNFSDLVQRRKGISQAAWTKVNQTILNSTSKVGTFDIYTGPKTKPLFDDYKKAANLVSRLFPNIAEPTSSIVIRYMYADLSWAEAKVAELLPKSEIERLTRNEGGRLLTSNCNSSESTCMGSKQLTLLNGTNLVLQGVPEKLYQGDLSGKERFYSGMLEAHEYFHGLQRIPVLGIGIDQGDYPPVWFVEGSAEWVQNAAINHADFSSYKNYFQLDCLSVCKALKKNDILKILGQATNSSWPSGYDYFLNYSLGAIFIESLVAISNPESIMVMYKEIATRVGFATAFKNVYGMEWKEAIPLLAEAVYLNLQES